MENKFAPMPLKVDLVEDHKEALTRAKRVSRDMKKNYAKVYAIYFLSLVTSYILPLFILKICAEKMTKPFTMAFSNTPGVLRHVKYKEVKTLGMATSFVCAGRVAISIGILSYAEKIQFSVTSDTCVTVPPEEIRKHLEKAIDEFIEMGKKIEDAPESSKTTTEEGTDSKKK